MTQFLAILTFTHFFGKFICPLHGYPFYLSYYVLPGERLDAVPSTSPCHFPLPFPTTLNSGYLRERCMCEYWDGSKEMK